MSGEVIVLYQDAFQHLDKTNCVMLPTKLLGPLLRFVGENPSDAEVQVRQLCHGNNTKAMLCSRIS